MKLLYIFLFIILPSAIFAQSNYHEGYVLKTNGDTLKGYIDYREWEQSPKSIDFKTNKDDKQILSFDPQTIKGFQITGLENYVSYTGIISMNRTSFPDLPVGSDTSKTQATVFLKQVATGSHITLFYHNDLRKSRFFIAEGNEKPVELKYYQYYTDERDVTEKTIYKGQLIFYINKFNNGDTKLMNKAERTHYSESDLESLVDDINGSVTGRVKNNNSATYTKRNFRMFVGAGANFTKTRYINSQFVEIIATPVGGNQVDLTSRNYRIQSIGETLAPEFNFGFDMFVNPNVQRLIFRAELSLSYVSAKLSYPESGQTVPINGTYTFNQYTATITPQLIFNAYNKDNFKIYIDAGVGFNFSAYSNNKVTTPQTNVTTNRPYDLEPYYASLPIQAGIVLNKKIDIAFTFVKYATYTSYNDIALSNQSMCLGVKYFFGDK